MEISSGDSIEDKDIDVHVFHFKTNKVMMVAFEIIRRRFQHTID